MIVLKEDSIKILMNKLSNGTVPVSRSYTIVYFYTDGDVPKSGTVKVSLFKANPVTEIKTRCITAAKTALGI